MFYPVIAFKLLVPKTEIRPMRQNAGAPVGRLAKTVEGKTMMRNKPTNSVINLLFTFLLTLPVVSLAADPMDADALKGLTSAKAVFDITTAEPKKLNFYLNLIENTAKSMEAQGVKSDFVLSFRGPATFYTSMDRKRIKMEDITMADKISVKLQSLSKTPGIQLNQCAVAAKALKVDTKTINPAVKVVGNSWISLIGYQNKGYALVPVR
jgi:intracellular sulfur oxidation DsrE/DsrF family protein